LLSDESRLSSAGQSAQLSHDKLLGQSSDTRASRWLLGVLSDNELLTLIRGPQRPASALHSRRR
jgi:hypothetical protein